MKIILIAVLILSVSGCASQYTPKIQEAHFTVQIIDDFNYADSPTKIGEANCRGSHCLIRIKRQYYPQGIAHEVRHVFEGSWHGATNNGQDFYDGDITCK